MSVRIKLNYCNKYYVKPGTYLWTRRGGKHPLLLLSGYTYSYQKRNADGRVTWYCSRRLKGCRAGAISMGPKCYTLKAHDHPPCEKLPICVTDVKKEVDGHLLPSGRGRHPLLLFHGYTYWWTSKKDSIFWRCSKRSSLQCMAVVKSRCTTPCRVYQVLGAHNHGPPDVCNHPAVRIQEPRGNNRLTMLWYCSQRRTLGCKSWLRTTQMQPETVTGASLVHNHDPTYHRTPRRGLPGLAEVRARQPDTGDERVTDTQPRPAQLRTDEKRNVGQGILIKTTNGKRPLLLYKNYTFFIKVESYTLLWYCSSRKAGCRASLKSVRDNPTLVTSESLRHNHDPPNYHQTKNGTWVKI
ncbi:hypothetical protein JYU34_004343 [Plutella xylostella]|uniref:FLYWCH-type domain-containing protein n=1 Tax=Plutella xylostella TaxID=51655 RepID=A0ABQ7QXR9_PLUXY|nr:hypothetical protein JYU34_004343 [Plutella xylostella]